MGLAAAGAALTLTLYGAASWLAFIGLRQTTRRRTARVVAAAGFLVETVTLGLRAGQGRFDLADVALFTSWLIVGSFLLLARRPGRLGMGLFFLPLAFFFLLPGLTMPAQHSAPSALILWFHFATTIAGVGAVCVAGITAAMHLVSERGLQSRRQIRLARHLPPLPELRDIVARMTRYGYPLIMLGVLSEVLMGAVLRQGVLLILWAVLTAALLAQATGRWRVALYLMVVSLVLSAAEIWGPGGFSMLPGA